MRSTDQIALVVFGLLLLAVDQAPAQPLVHRAESLESLVINADRVWVAKIIEVRDEPIPGGSEMPGITIAIEETLKYPLFEERRFEKRGLFVEHPTTAYHEFYERSSRLLIAHSDDYRYSPRLIELAPGKTEVFMADFTLLRDPETVVQAARETISRIPPNVRRLHTMRFSIPTDVLAETKFGPYAELVVPVDEQLEKRAIASLNSKSYSMRLASAKALRYFKSEKNIDRLRMLLDDPGYYQDSHIPKYYGVRDNAYQTLKAWGIEVERPVIEEPDHYQSE